MNLYPFQSPIILTDALFAQYGGGGYTGTFSNALLQAAYRDAEIKASNYIGAPLLPVIVTGTFPYMGAIRVATDWGYVSRILAVKILAQNIIAADCNLITNDGCAFIYEDTFGYVDVHQTLAACSFWLYAPPSSFINYYPPYRGTPYQFQITYEAGLPTGTASLPGILLALAIAAKIYLNEISPGLAGINEGVGDIGIQEFRSLDYSERRTPLKHTAFGSSAMANKAAQSIDSCITKARKSLRI